MADGYAHLDSASDGAVTPAAAARQQRAAAATALCSVVRFVLSGSTKFWAQPPVWLSAMWVGTRVKTSPQHPTHVKLNVGFGIEVID